MGGDWTIGLRLSFEGVPDGGALRGAIAGQTRGGPMQSDWEAARLVVLFDGW